MKYFLFIFLLFYALPSLSCKQSPEAWTASLKQSIDGFIKKSVRTKYKSYAHAKTVKHPEKKWIQDNRSLILLQHKKNKTNPCVALEISSSTEEKGCTHKAKLLSTEYIPRTICEFYIK